MRVALVVTTLVSGIGLGCSEPPRPLTAAQLRDIEVTLKEKDLDPPRRIEVASSGFVVAGYEISDTSPARLNPRAFAEARLLAIREVLLGDGYRNYRVNVNGPPPGTGLIRRYGSARYIDGGEVEWLTP